MSLDSNPNQHGTTHNLTYAPPPATPSRSGGCAWVPWTRPRGDRLSWRTLAQDREPSTPAFDSE
jgi:hypothetical protein